MTIDDVKVTLVDSVDEAGQFMTWLGERRPIKLVAFDTETTGLSPENDRVRLVQYGDAEQGWVIPFERWGGVVEDAVRRWDGFYTMHNAPFDVAMMQAMKITIPKHKVHCTRLQAHVLNSTGPLALKTLAAMNVDGRAAHMQSKLDEALGKNGAWTWETVPIMFQPYWTYAGLDPILTYQLHQLQYPQVMTEAPRSYQLEMAVAWVAERMMRNGVRIDRTYTLALRDKLAAFCAQSLEWCRYNYGITSANANQQIVRKLINEGVQMTTLTKGGMKAFEAGDDLEPKHFSAAKDVLDGIEHPLAHAVLEWRRCDRMIGTYLNTYLELSEGDVRIHPSINTVGGTAKNHYDPGGKKGVRTGRMSMNNPNFQNVPVRGHASNLIRNCFVAEGRHTNDGVRGHKWLKADFDQIEMRLFAHHADDTGMIAAFKDTSLDFFVNMARQIFNDQTIEKSDPRRQPVKNSGYAWIYGAGHEQFAKTAGMLLPDGSPDIGGAAAFMARVNSLYPGGTRHINRVMDEGRRHRRDEGVTYIRSIITGRKFRADAGREYPLVNYQIQGEAGELLKLKMVEAAQAGLDEYMTIPVHDEIDMDVPEDRADDALTSLRDVMRDDTILSVPVTASLSVGTRWGGLEDIA